MIVGAGIHIEENLDMDFLMETARAMEQLDMDMETARAMENPRGNPKEKENFNLETDRPMDPAMASRPRSRRSPKEKEKDDPTCQRLNRVPRRTQPQPFMTSFWTKRDACTTCSSWPMTTPVEMSGVSMLMQIGVRMSMTMGDGANITTMMIITGA